MNALLRRRGMMQKAEEILVHFVPGEYDTLDRRTVVHEDGTMTAPEESKGILYGLVIPLTGTVYYQAGDVITVAQDRNYDSLRGFWTSGIYNRSTRVTTKIVNNKNVAGYASFSETMIEDGYFDAFRSINGTSFIGQRGPVKLLIYKNGKLVVG